MKSYFQELPVELEEAAIVDGDTRWGAFIRIAVPLARPGLAATAILRGSGLPVEPQAWLSLIVIAPCGLPLAFACRRLRRLGYPAAAWAAMAVLGSATVGASLFAGLLGPVAIAVYAVVLSLPVWLVCRLVDRRR